MLELNVSSGRPIIVAGMHRSGTSLVGSLMNALGVDMGLNLVPADAQNPRGYFEDADVVSLHGRMFQDALNGAESGHVDWGWTEEGAVDPGALEGWADEAKQAVAGRGSRRGNWGFKDPRATLALDLWREALPEARYVLVFRYPWDVSDSVQRLGASVFSRNPSYGYRIWEAYNRRLLEFYEANQERSVLICSNGLPMALDRLPQLLEEKLGLHLEATDLAAIFDSDLYTRGGGDDRRPGLVSIAYPECLEVLSSLECRADISSDGLWKEAVDRASRFGRVHPENPTLSIVVPTYNDGVLLLDALASAEQFAPTGAELVIVNDGSSDPESIRILQSLSDAGYRLIHQDNSGLSAARNAGVRATTSPYILPLDADNRLIGGFMDEALDALRSTPQVGVAYGNRRVFGAMQELIEVPEFQISRMLGGNYIDACAMFRRSAWEEIGGYDTGMTGLEDWDFWISMFEAGWGFKRMDTVGFEYRVRADSLLEVSLKPRTRRGLLRHIREKHPDLFHSHIPRFLRAASLLAARLLPRGAADRIRRMERACFWSALWRMVGPGGLFARDRAVYKARMRASD